MTLAARPATSSRSVLTPSAPHDAGQALVPSSEVAPSPVGGVSSHDPRRDRYWLHRTVVKSIGDGWGLCSPPTGRSDGAAPASRLGRPLPRRNLLPRPFIRAPPTGEGATSLDRSTCGYPSRRPLAGSLWGAHTRGRHGCAGGAAPAAERRDDEGVACRDRGQSPAAHCESAHAPAEPSCRRRTPTPRFEA